MKRLLAALNMFVALGLWAESPDWAKPYLKQPAPSGSYIAKDDQLVALMYEVEVGLTREGGLFRTHRMVLMPTGKHKTEVVLEIDYDEATQKLRPPEVWIPGAFGYKSLNMKKRALDLPSFSEYRTSDREFYFSAKPLEPGEKAVVTWTVDDRFAFPGEATFFPPWGYPCVLWKVRTAPSQTEKKPFLYQVMRTEGVGTHPLEGDVSMTEIPALKRVRRSRGMWGAAYWEEVPYVVAAVEAPDWGRLGGRVAQLFDEALQKDKARTYAREVAKLVAAAGSQKERVVRVAEFAQKLSYREIAWGRGAYEPEPPHETLRTATADCKGKVLLLQAMLAELGVRSVPVLCRSSQDYLSSFPLPCFSGFNHVILAIEPSVLGEMPASLLSGPGQGWVIYDPTDPLAVLGLPPNDLEGTPGLWCAKGKGASFTIMTRRPGSSIGELKITVELESFERARCTLSMEDRVDFLTSVVVNRYETEDKEQFRTRCEEYFRGEVPGLKVEAVHFTPPDHLGGVGPRLDLQFSVPAPLQPAGGGLSTLSFPMAIFRLAFGFPRMGYRKAEPQRESEKISDPKWAFASNYQGNNHRWSGTLTLKIPEGFSLESWPALKTAIHSPWLTVEVESAEDLTLTAEMFRGRFEATQESQRLKDLNAFCALFRQPILLRSNPPSS